MDLKLHKKSDKLAQLDEQHLFEASSLSMLLQNYVTKLRQSTIIMECKLLS